ncbi:MAG: YciI family protein [Acidimicrobiales bacterium]
MLEKGDLGATCRIEASPFVVGVRGGLRGGPRLEEIVPMAQYLISVLADDTIGTATAEEAAAIDVFNEQLQTDGQWVFAAGLASPSVATVIDGRGEEAILTDGPFAETKEYAAGFWIIEAPDFDVALRLATQGSKHCNRRVELRPIL